MKQPFSRLQPQGPDLASDVQSLADESLLELQKAESASLVDELKAQGQALAKEYQQQCQPLADQHQPGASGLKAPLTQNQSDMPEWCPVPEQQSILALASADQAGRDGFEQEEVASPAASCPIIQNKVYIAPVRYALAEQAAQHPNFNPAFQAVSHPQALRMLREGYLYLWQEQEGLRRFAVNQSGLITEQALSGPYAKEKPQGGEPGVMLNGDEPVFLLFTERPLLPAHYENLQQSSTERQQKMRRFQLSPLQGLAPGTKPAVPHCMPAEETLLAELMPEIKERVNAVDYRDNGDKYRADVDGLGERMMENPTPTAVQAYIHSRTWLSNLEQAYHQHGDKEEAGQWSAVQWNTRNAQFWLEKACSDAQKQGLQPWLLALDDRLGDLRDINNEQELVEGEHQQWQEEHSHRTAIAGFIRSLITEDGAELAQRLSYRFREQDIEITPEQGEQLLDAQSRLKPLLAEETRINHERGRQYSHEDADRLLLNVHGEISQVTDPLREFIPENLYGQIRLVAMEYSEEKVSHLSDGMFDTQVAERVRLREMNHWLDVAAPEHYTRVNEKHALLFADRSYLYESHGLEMWYVDYDSDEHNDWLCELSFNTLSAACARPEGIVQVSELIRSPNAESPLSLLASGWQPKLDQLVSDASRIGELNSVFSANNAAAVSTQLRQLLPPSTLATMKELGSNAQGLWSTTVSRLSAAFIELKKDTVSGLNGTAQRTSGGLAPAWASLMLILFQGDAARFEQTLKNNKPYWRVWGERAQNLNQYVHNTVNSMRAGSTQTAQQVSALARYGGVLPLTILGINMLNSINKANNSFEGQSTADDAQQLSAYLYTGAALLSVIQVATIARVGQEVTVYRMPVNFLYAFTGLVGFVSAGAAGIEYIAISREIELAESAVDPYLRLRQQVVAGQTLVYFSQGVLGVWAFLSRASGFASASQIAARFRVGNFWIILLQVALGAGYAYLLLKQGSPLQNFLSDSCWGWRQRWNGNIDAEQKALVELLFTPKVEVKKGWLTLLGDGIAYYTDPTGFKRWVWRALDGEHITTFEQLSLDLPAAEPETTEVKIKILAQGSRDIGSIWMRRMKASWIPHEDGQGLRLSSDCEGLTTPLYIYVQYQNPIKNLFPEQETVGGGKGKCYRFNDKGEASLLTRDEYPAALAGARAVTINETNINLVES
ncbi:toxin VasX [Oceanimonas baumannii]|uniref:toxin VasX n=1 Tax=Oceanimonas baumannii TaxID=129578 RepID=UPI003A94AD71